jgi:photosystem II stability/assembly factor-like uncharacterized protein
MPRKQRHLAVTIVLGFSFLAALAWTNSAAGVASKAMRAADISPVTLLEPSVLTPTLAACEQSYWFPISTALSSTAYLTLNTQNPAYSTNHAEWRPNLPEEAIYRVEAYIPAHDPITFCTNQTLIDHDTTEAQYTVRSSVGVTTIVRNQQTAAGTWIALGDFHFRAGSSGSVQLTDLNHETDFTTTVSFSAMRWTYLRPAEHVFLPMVRMDVAQKTPTPTPPPPFVVAVTQRQGFDACVLPSESSMQAWWDGSPYFYYGLYLGGVASAVENPNSGCKKATLSWVTAVAGQGWQFIPTWVGLQAPCSSFLPEKRMSADAAIAFRQGRSEADAAANASISFGLTDGTKPIIIYFDLESYSASDTACQATVKSFLNGWTQRIHELGHTSGVYGGCRTAPEDWIALAYPPDDIWIANWFSERKYNPNASAYDLCNKAIPNDVWPNRRIRQYSGDHTETWGNGTITRTLNIDSNVANGQVVSPTFSAGAGLSSELLRPAPQVDAFGVIDRGQGWVLAGVRLFALAGGLWREIAQPSDAPTNAFFLDENTGWVSGFRGDTFSVWETLDAGESWQELPVSFPLDWWDWQPVSLQFVDQTTGWITWRSVGGSSFSQGRLFFTTDGGKTWTGAVLPAGGETAFVSAQEGWLLGSVGGVKLYRTQDGGRTWEGVPTTLGAEIHSLDVIASAAGDRVWAASPEGAIPLDGSADPQVNAFSPNFPENILAVDLSSPQIGWALSAVGKCRGFKQDCGIVTRLWQTLDGGQTWVELLLPELFSAP